LRHPSQLPDFEGHFPVIGSWLIGQETAGIGIREADTLITDNLSMFVPHLIDS
jgi:glutathionylspermidine synthase